MLDSRFVGGLALAAFVAAAFAGHLAATRAARGGDGAVLEVAAAPGPSANEGEVWRVPIGSAPGRGDADALVTMVVFTDLGPEGQRLEKLVSELEAQRHGEVRFALRVLSSGATASAAEALFAAQGQNKFFELRERLGDVTSRPLRREALDAVARAAGLDVEKLHAALDSGKPMRRADADRRFGVSLGITTPTVFVNGARLERPSGSRVVEELTRQKARAQALIAGGVRPAQVYAELTKDGRTVASGGALPPGTKVDRPLPPRRREDPDAIYRVDVEGAPVRGPADALVTIVELGDFQCPFCKQAEAALADILARHPRDVRLVWRNSPLSSHPEGRPAAIAAMAAHAQGKFWPVHDALFEAQRELGPETYERIAKGAHLDLARFRTAVAAPDLGQAIALEAATGSRLGAIGTPVFFVNGKKLRGFRTAEPLVALVDRELERAQQLVREEHVARADLYARIVRDGARQPVFLATPGPSAPESHRGASVQDLRPGQVVLPAPRTGPPKLAPTQP